MEKIMALIAALILAAIAAFVLGCVSVEMAVARDCDDKGSYHGVATKRMIVCTALPPDDLPQ